MAKLKDWTIDDAKTGTLLAALEDIQLSAVIANYYNGDSSAYTADSAVNKLNFHIAELLDQHYKKYKIKQANLGIGIDELGLT